MIRMIMLLIMQKNLHMMNLGMMKVIEIIMSTLEATVDMMERLSEENLVKVQYVTRQQANAGRYRDAQEDVNDIRRGVLYKNDK